MMQGSDAKSVRFFECLHVYIIITVYVKSHFLIMPFSRLRVTVSSQSPHDSAVYSPRGHRLPLRRMSYSICDNAKT